MLSIYDDLASIPPFDEDLDTPEAEGPTVVRRLRESVSFSHGVLISTPEYNRSIPGLLKNALDWLSRPPSGAALTGKPVAIIGASPGQSGTRRAQAALRQGPAAMGAVVLPSPTMFLSEAAGLFDPEGRLVDEPTRDRLKALLSAFHCWMHHQGCHHPTEVVDGA